jgi:predicted dehydrogenase
MRTGIVGLGLRAGNVLKMIQKEMPELELVGYVDPDPCGLSIIEEHASQLKQFESLANMISESELDLLWVASPNHLHLEHIKLGLEAGLQVFSEKPIVTSKEDSFELAKLIKKFGENKLIVGLVLRYSTHMREMRRVLDAGTLGSITSLEANEHIAPFHGSFFMRDWRRLEKYSGGFMLEKCCHDIDLYNSIVGERPLRVVSFGGRNNFIPSEAPSDNKYDNVYQKKLSYWENVDNPFTSDADIIDHQNALIEYPNQVTFSFHTSINVPDEQRRFCVIGSRGMAEGDFGRGGLRITDARTGDCLEEHDFSYPSTPGLGNYPSHYGADQLMCEDIVSFLRGGLSSLPVGPKEAIAAGLVAMAIDESMKTSQIVDMTETWQKLDSLY